MKKRRQKPGPKSLDWLLRRLRAQLKKIGLAKEIVPPELEGDPKGLLAWMRENERRRRRRKKWE